jgi:hypothetical protein
VATVAVTVISPVMNVFGADQPSIPDVVCVP